MQILSQIKGSSAEMFLMKSGWGDASQVKFPADWGTRTYARLTQDNGQTALLMDVGPDTSLDDYLKTARYLGSIGLHTPEIYAVDEAAGLALIEDFGAASFGACLKNPAIDNRDIYTIATEALIHLRQNADITALDLPFYPDTAYHIGKRRLADWYIPALRGEANPDGLVEGFIDVWNKIEAGLPECPQTICHADYHPDNLMWRGDKTGLDRCGIIDFQDAFIGPLPYDLVNLLEDIRNDIPDDTRAAMKNRYCEGMSAEEKEAFESWYQLCAAHFHCRIAGQCFKLAVRSGRDDLLRFLPRVEGYLRKDLQAPVLSSLKAWCDEQKLDFLEAPSLNGEDIKFCIRDDAY